MDVTIVVVPRERFRPLPDSLRSLFSTIPRDIRVIVVDGGAGEDVRGEVRSIKHDRSFEHIESDEFLLPGAARNIALDLVETKYVVYCDNDVTYSPEWLELLYRNAEQNGSTAVAPVTLIGPSEPKRIHHAGGMLKLVKDGNGNPVLRGHHRLGNTDLPEAENSGFRGISCEHDYFEYHCVLVKTEAMRAIGGHDERLTIFEHLDSSLRLKAAGGKITFEPGSKIMYTAFNRFVDEDWPYFLYRWSKKRATNSNKIFSENWGVNQNNSFAGIHQQRAMMTVLPRLPKLLNRARIKQGLLRLFIPRILSFDPGIPDDPAVKALDRPPLDGLKAAGIAGA